MGILNIIKNWKDLSSPLKQNPEENDDPLPYLSLTERLKDLKNQTAKDLMVPRTLAPALDVDLQLSKVHRIKNPKFSYLAVYRGDLDNILGWVDREQIEGLIGSDDTIQAHLHTIRTVREDEPLDEVFQKFVETSSPLFVVKSGQGLTSGILYLADILKMASENAASAATEMAEGSGNPGQADTPASANGL
jgi:CBS domain containing-hemolysin-like protein